MINSSNLVIATRASDLAIAQAQEVLNKLKVLYPKYDINLLPVTTKGDIILDRSLSKIGGKGLFIKEIENTLLSGKADIAVHSLKDMPVDIPNDFKICAVLERIDSRDAFISNIYPSINFMPNGSIIGTSSLRRASQIKCINQNLIVKNLRGNINTRLNKLNNGDYSAIILATAGLIRLNKANIISSIIDKSIMMPAVSQGAICVEILKERKDIEKLLLPLDHIETRYCVETERIISKTLGADCHMPLAANAIISNNNITINALIASCNGTNIIKAQTDGYLKDRKILARNVAKSLLDQGAYSIIKESNNFII